MTATRKVPITGLGYDPDFGGIDLTGCPSLRPLSSSDSSWLDPRFAPLDQSGQGQGNALKEFLTEQLAEKEGPTTVYASGCQFRVFYRDGAWHADGEIDGTRHRYSATDRDALLSKLAATQPRELHRAPIPYRDLNEKELLEIARYVQSGDTQAALSQYMYFATDKREIASPFEILDDPRYKGLCDAAVLFVWQHSRTEYAPTPARAQFIDAYVAERPLSLALLDSAFRACQEAEKRGALLQQFQPDEPEVADPREVQASLEESSDADIERMMRETKKQYAREVHAGMR